MLLKLLRQQLVLLQQLLLKLAVELLIPVVIQLHLEQWGLQLVGGQCTVPILLLPMLRAAEAVVVVGVLLPALLPLLLQLQLRPPQTHGAEQRRPPHVEVEGAELVGMLLGQLPREPLLVHGEMVQLLVVQPLLQQPPLVLQSAPHWRPVAERPGEGLILLMLRLPAKLGVKERLPPKASFHHGAHRNVLSLSLLFSGSAW
mmetsp:Transcript_86690/g.248736  ORF Transcript_86690/g.248736 Transcript_86690/m.248736 type:complete len:201 (-) Transcript_86690:6-608(-)